jgi:hypothetical protein
VLVGQRIVTSSSVLVDEEHFDWAPPPKRHQPLTAHAHAAAPPPRPTLPPIAIEPLPPIAIEPLPPFPSRPPFTHGGAPTSADGGASPSPAPSVFDGGALSPSSPPSLLTHLRDPRASPITFPSLDTPAPSPDAPRRAQLASRGVATPCPFSSRSHMTTILLPRPRSTTLLPSMTLSAPIPPERPPTTARPSMPARSGWPPRRKSWATTRATDLGPQSLAAKFLKIAASTSSFGSTSSSATAPPRRDFACRATRSSPASTSTTRLGPRPSATHPLARSSPTRRVKDAECAALTSLQRTYKAS